MGKKVQVKFENKLLTQLLKNMKQKGYVKVGIIDADKNQRTSTDKDGKKKDSNVTNAYIGAVHEFGIKAGKKEYIPRRSFLQMPLVDDFDEALKHKGDAKELTKQLVTDPYKFLNKLGNVALAVIKEAFKRGGSTKTKWQSENKYYWAEKKNKEILVESTQLRESISYKVFGEFGGHK